MNNARGLVLLLLVVASWLSPPAPAGAQEDGPAEQAIGLVNQGNVERAIEVLREHLKTNTKDVRARIVLGRILDFDGRADEAVTLWGQGLTGKAADFPLLMSIGETRRRQGEEGPLISHKRGMVGAHPSKNAAEEERLRRAWLAEAATAYEKARKLQPGDADADADATSALASVYVLQKKPEAAVDLWKSLVASRPKNSDHQLALALALQQADRPDEAAKSLEKAIELNPRFARAYEALADYQKAKGRTAEEEHARARANFYKQLPSFSKLDYSNDHAKILEDLNDQATVRKLIDDPSETATEFLTVLCWSHPHNVLETRAFDALEARGDRTTPLLRAMFDGAQSTCTIKSAGHILARRKVGGLVDDLVNRLPGDVRGFGMDMDIAGSLDDLGDAKAVAPLVQVLNPEAAAAPEDGPNGMLQDRGGARQRAALALGAFDTPESRHALEAATKIPRVAAASLAALYRLARDRKYLAALEKAVAPDDAYTSFVVGNYLRKKVGTDEAKELAQTWEKRREEQRADDERAKEQEQKKAGAGAGAKPKQGP